jgi:hypothetical protein
MLGRNMVSELLASLSDIIPDCLCICDRGVCHEAVESCRLCVMCAMPGFSDRAGLGDWTWTRWGR